MSGLLHPADINLWLNHNMHDPDRLKRLYQPLPAEELTAVKVSDLVNNPRFDAQACIARV